MTTKTFFKRDMQGRAVLEIRYHPVTVRSKEYALYKSKITDYWEVCDPIDGKTLLSMFGRTLTTPQAILATIKELPNVL